MTQKNWLQTFTRSSSDYWIGGVCGGLGGHTPIPSWTWRLLFVLLFLFYGTGLLIYILLWIFVPPKSEPKDEK
ncbi:MAG TPA: PspC domain-containing protein [Smithellaceae bacterium]|jgi:phage shock protein PspC (stress-responsive transcriptional regulator)|nr:PspC domain-containing protein [Smithellaceae bacterium]HQO14930.1 PspC domain-containing protein [Smithellaceae bacterium]